MCKQCLLLELKIKGFYLDLNMKIKAINYYIMPYYKKVCFKKNINKIKNFIIYLDIIPPNYKKELIQYIQSSKFTNL